MKKLKRIQRNDLIDILAPGSASVGSEADDQIQRAVQFVESWGLKARVSPGLFSGHPYLSNTDEFRFKDLKRALMAKDSSAIFSLRGGYGSLRLIPDLLKMKTPLQPKIFLGYSDLTSLHLFFNQNWKWLSVHGPLLDGLAQQKHTSLEMSRLRSFLFGELPSPEMKSLVAMNARAEKAKSIRGSISGGNLVVFSSHYGTSLSPQLKNKILFFEEISERGYRVDRMLAQLEQQKNFAEVQAVVFGEFVGGQEKNGESFVNLALEDFAKRVRIPVFKGLPVGHGEVNLPILMGAKAELLKNKDSSFQLQLDAELS